MNVTTRPNSIARCFETGNQEIARHYGLWKASQFNIHQLIAGTRTERGPWNYSPHLFPLVDHARYFSQEGHRTPFCIITHTYIPEDDLLAETRRILPVTLAAGGIPRQSWWFEACTPVVICRPENRRYFPDVAWLQPISPY